MAKINATLTANRERAKEVYRILNETYPDATCSLDYTNPLELIVAVILSAQCTDERVNKTTPALFRKFKTAEDYAAAPQEEIEQVIKSCGFYKNKAKSIKKMATSLIEEHGGEVPGTMEELVQLGGVGRKTANVVLGECFDGQGIIVDTHCKRVNQRLQFTKNDDPVKIEKDLMKVLPDDKWTQYSHLMVFHGRNLCIARAPKCSQCPIEHLCPFPDTREGKKIAK